MKEQGDRGHIVAWSWWDYKSSRICVSQQSKPQLTSVSVIVGVRVGVLEGPNVRVGVGVLVRVRVGEGPQVSVRVGVLLGVRVLVGVRVGDGPQVGVRVGVRVGGWDL